MQDTIEWLMEQGEPWVRYRTMLDLLGLPETEPEVIKTRDKMLSHPKVQQLVADVADWPGLAIKRHNDASHLIYKLSTLADFGIQRDDPGMASVVETVLNNQSPSGAFRSLVNVPMAFGGTGEDQWTWIACDAPTLLYALLAMGLGHEPRVKQAIEHQVSLIKDNGWRCVCAQELGKFRGPGRKADPCPIANVYALKALAMIPDFLDSSATRTGTEMLLWHWGHQHDRKIYMFGIGSDFRKLKYPFVWYDILHVMDVLSRFQFAHTDSRMLEMVEVIASQADENGHYRASSMYRAWNGWEFADKKSPSPWITFLVLRIRKRLMDLSKQIMSTN